MQGDSAPNTSPATTFSDVNYLPITFFDAMWLRFPPTQRVFFYEIHDLSFSVFNVSILPKLKHALSLTLQYYPSLAGNLTWHSDSGKPVIRFAPDEDGVFLTVAESTADFHSLSTHDFKEANLLYSLFSDFPVSHNQATIISLQVTLFPGNGFSISYTAHHAAFDGKSAAVFFKSWAQICHLGFLPPVFDRSLINDPLDICTIFTDVSKKYPLEGRTLNIFDMKPPPGLFRGSFRLNRQQIGHIKSKLVPGPVSTFTAVCSYIWTCLVKAEGGTNTITNENVNFSISMDCRGRLDPPIPANYIGNCITLRITTEKGCIFGGGGDDGLVTAAKWLSEAASAFRVQKTYSVGGSPLFELYRADFGWGRPTKVEMVSIDKTGAFSLCDARDHDNGGMEIGIVLSKPKIEAFASIFVKGLEEIANE